MKMKVNTQREHLSEGEIGGSAGRVKEERGHKGVFFCPGILVALPGCEINFQRGLPPDGRSIIDNIFSMLGSMYMGHREQDGTGNDSEISHRVRAPGAVGK
jgi:hypothetical protein